MEQPADDDADQNPQSGRKLLEVISRDRHDLIKKYNSLLSKTYAEEGDDSNEASVLSKSLRDHQDEIDDIRRQVQLTRNNPDKVVIVSLESVLETKISPRSFAIGLVPLLETSDLAKDVLANWPDTADLTNATFISIPGTESMTLTLFNTWLATSPGSFLPIQEPPHLRNTSVNEAQLFKLYKLALYLRSVDLVYAVFDAFINRFAARGQFFPATAVHIIYDASSTGSASTPIDEADKLLRALVIDFFTRATGKFGEMFNESRMVTNTSFYSDWARHMAMREASNRQKARQGFTDTEIGFGSLKLDDLKTKMKALWAIRVSSDWPSLKQLSIRYIEDLHRDPASYDPRVKEPRDVLFERFEDMTISSDATEEEESESGSSGVKDRASSVRHEDECRRCYGTGKTPSRKLACSACDGTGKINSKKRGASAMTQSSPFGISDDLTVARRRRVLNLQPRMRSFATGIPGFNSDEETDSDEEIKMEEDKSTNEEVRPQETSHVVTEAGNNGDQDTAAQNFVTASRLLSEIEGDISSQLPPPTDLRPEERS